MKPVGRAFPSLASVSPFVKLVVEIEGWLEKAPSFVSGPGWLQWAWLDSCSVLKVEPLDLFFSWLWDLKARRTKKDYKGFGRVLGRTHAGTGVEREL